MVYILSSDFVLGMPTHIFEKPQQLHKIFTKPTFLLYYSDLYEPFIYFFILVFNVVHAQQKTLLGR